jgi:hypothetical protein
MDNSKIDTNEFNEYLNFLDYNGKVPKVRTPCNNSMKYICNQKDDGFLVYLSNYNINNNLITNYSIKIGNRILEDDISIELNKKWTNLFKKENDIELQWKIFGYNNMNDIFNRLVFLRDDYPSETINELFSNFEINKLYFNFNNLVINVNFNKIQRKNQYWMMEMIDSWNQFKFFAYCENIIFFTRKHSISKLISEYNTLKSNNLFENDLTKSKIMINGIPPIFIFNDNDIKDNKSISNTIYDLLIKNSNNIIKKEYINNIIVIKSKKKEYISKFRNYQAVMILNLNNKEIINKILSVEVNYLHYKITFEKHKSRYQSLIEENPILELIQACMRCHTTGHTGRFCKYFNEWRKNEIEKINNNENYDDYTKKSLINVTLQNPPKICYKCGDLMNPHEPNNCNVLHCRDCGSNEHSSGIFNCRKCYKIQEIIYKLSIYFQSKYGDNYMKNYEIIKKDFPYGLNEKMIFKLQFSKNNLKNYKLVTNHKYARKSRKFI